MRLCSVVLAAVCFVSLAVHAQELPDAPQPVTFILRAADAPTIPDLSAVPAATVPVTLPAPALLVTVTPPKPKVIDNKFIVLNAMHFALTVADVELTQRCMHAGTCRELNPTLPHSRLGMYAVNTATNVAVTYFSYRRKKSGKWGWWLAPAIDVGAHAVGVGSNFRFVF